ncbi:MAG: BREX-1 system adenine-specific DNA-methyltransferase PglX [Cyanobacteria bacterium J06634_6]
MDTSGLKKFAQGARRQLMAQVETKLGTVLAEGSAARRERLAVVEKLEEQIALKTREQVIEQVAYTWFNRFCALRYMDVRRYTRIGVVSPVEGQFQPEMLAEAKMGQVDEDVVPTQARQQILGLLDGSIPSADGQTEAYRLLVVAVCNDYHKVMPFLFERIDDYTELLMPDDLLSQNSVLAQTRAAMTDENCKNVEVIGWLYQFYISEKKDEVFAGLKKNKKITPENIPAATQLFTPHWIVRYLVENSLGRLWLLNRPGSGLKAQMDYYIEPEQAETDFLRVGSPEELKVCDPACGSGHMLTYAFDLLYAIYEEELYDPEEIPGKILTCNLYGIEIDERAGTLAAFALTMKARERQRRFFQKGMEPNICVLENVRFEEGELDEYMDFIGRDVFTAPLLETLRQFEEADNFGALIRPAEKDIAATLNSVKLENGEEKLLFYRSHQKVLKALQQADYLSPRYHAVITNPPYMGGKGMNRRLSSWVKKQFPDSKADIMTCFMDRATELNLRNGYWGMINLPSWMFLKSFEDLRSRLLSNNFIETLLHLGRGIFGSDFGSVAFVFKASTSGTEARGSYKRLFEEHVQVRSAEKIKQKFKDGAHETYVENQHKFLDIPGKPIAYWLSDNAVRNCVEFSSIGEFAEAKSGMSSCNSELFLRQWFEVSFKKINRCACSHVDSQESDAKWYPYNKGGGNRRWYGYNDVLINWANQGKEIKHFVTHNPRDPDTKHWSRRLFNLDFFFKEGFTWSAVTSGRFSCRVVPYGVIPGTGSKTLYSLGPSIEHAIFLLLNTNVASYYLSVFSPTLNFEAGDVVKIPVVDAIEGAATVAERLVLISKEDWNSQETSWDFSISPFVDENSVSELRELYNKRRLYWQNLTGEMQKLEETNNLSFIKAYGLQKELTPETPLREISLDCNPHYRYDHTKPEAELEALLLADTMREFISYAVGCMFGRYSLDAPGLILANQGETLTDYLIRIPNPTFTPDADNVIPILDGEWFTDDITERFTAFLRTTFGTDHYTENLKFIEDAIGKDIRKFFLKDFYKDHLKRYKKRPIYWLFSSPKGTFNALIYMHRYRSDTVSVILNDYLREFQTKLQNRKSQREQISISAAASNAEKTKALKDIDKLNKQILELETYERDILYPLATKQIEIDLDDGVKVNYPKFGKALKKVAGLS